MSPESPGSGKLPVLALTMGDPAGIGPEICLAAAADAEVRAVARPLVVGDLGVLERALVAVRGRTVPAGLRLRAVDRPGEASFEPGTVEVIDLANVPAESFEWGVVRAGFGRAAYEYLERASRLAMAGEVDAVVTAPIHKEAWRLAGIPAVGHTEALQMLSGAGESVTLFVVRNLRTFFYTRHLPLEEAIHRIREAGPGGLARFLRTADALLLGLGIAPRRIAVAGLNPHAGEHGLLGREEQEVIGPAVALARQEGVDAHGPVPADAVYHQALQGRWDAVVSLTHDQGHIATKTLDFERTVSLTLGLPFLRTSVDHGTAFDIAGKGVASAVSMKEAALVAARQRSAKG
ncbi:MAG: 4-hydroxythreonine-4-phosphate dehydrogenase PdxA [Bacillota bacterium]|nr:4-hydroxythreonine-4-phosphate dehydrogenase PdxA [Bacillota bacterium]